MWLWTWVWLWIIWIVMLMNGAFLYCRGLSLSKRGSVAQSITTRGRARPALVPQSLRHMGQSSSSLERNTDQSHPLHPLDTERTVFESLQRMGVPADATILLSVSGGCDSMAMLHLLQAVKHNFLPRLTLKVIHFNHKQREESEEEVRRWR